MTRFSRDGSNEVCGLALQIFGAIWRLEGSAEHDREIPHLQASVLLIYRDGYFGCCALLAGYSTRISDTTPQILSCSCRWQSLRKPLREDSKFSGGIAPLVEKARVLTLHLTICNPIRHKRGDPNSHQPRRRQLASFIILAQCVRANYDPIMYSCLFGSSLLMVPLRADFDVGRQL